MNVVDQIWFYEMLAHPAKEAAYFLKYAMHKCDMRKAGDPRGALLFRSLNHQHTIFFNSLTDELHYVIDKAAVEKLRKADYSEVIINSLSDDGNYQVIWKAN